MSKPVGETAAAQHIESNEISRGTPLEECQKLSELTHLLHEYGRRLFGQSSAVYQVGYWNSRVVLETSKQQPDIDNKTPPIFHHRGAKHQDTTVYDARSRLRLADLVSEANARGFGVEPEEYGLTRERLAADEIIVEQKRKQFQTATRYDEYRRARRTAQRYISDTLSKAPQVQNFIDADVLKPIKLLETPIRKVEIPPVLVSAIGCVAHTSFLELGDTDEAGDKLSYITWKKNTVESVATKITDKYYGNVTALIGIKLPATPDFIQEYFEDRGVEGIIPEHVQRLQFDATLSPTGKKPFISRINTVIYSAINSSGNRRVVTTSRKADSVAAELVIQSLQREAHAARIILDSNSYEVLAGLPSLGKRAR